MFSVYFMFALATLLGLITQVSGTPYISGGDSPSGTDCSGLASWIANSATGRPTFGDRFHTGNEWAALSARGFKPGTAPGALVIGWNGHHTAVTLPDGTPVSSGEGGGVKIGGGGAYQKQFTNHMYLPMPADGTQIEDPSAMIPVDLPQADPQLPPPPAPLDAPAPDAAQVVQVSAELPADPMAAPPVGLPEELPPPPAPEAPMVVVNADNIVPDAAPEAPAPGPFDTPVGTAI
jgi:hypothetical protein